MTGLETLGQLTPRGNRVLATAATLALPLTSAHRMVDRVHHHAADVRTTTQPTGASRLAEGNFLMGHIPDLSDGGITFDVKPADFSGGQLEKRVFAVDRRADRRGSGRANDLSATTRHHFNAVQG